MDISNEILEIIITVIVAVVGFTLIYKLAPFKEFKTPKPKFTLFPKYSTGFDPPISQIKESLEKLGFKATNKNTYTRGKAYGDFSAKAIKLTVSINEKDKHIKVYASFFGILFDTGDIWQVTSDILKV